MNYHEKQLEAIRLLGVDSPIEQVLYGGSAGNGKSFLGCDWQIKRRLKYPGTRGLIGRSELKKLRTSTMLTFWELCEHYKLRNGTHFNFNGQLNVIDFYNGSQILLMDLADLPSDPLFTRFGSIEITDYFVDEAVESSRKAVDILDSRVRYKLINGRPKGLLCSNPGKGWLYSDFFDAKRNGTLRADRAFVQALPKDNPHISQAYLDKLSRLSEVDRKRLLEGDWDYDESKDRIFEYSDLERIFTIPVTEGKRYVTADIAAMGDDETIVCVWSGLSLVKTHFFRHKYPHEIAQMIRQICTENSVPLSQTIVDSDGLGIGVYGILKCRQFLNGSAAEDKDAYENLRSECYYKLSDVIRNNQFACNVGSIRERLIRELDAIRRKNMHSEKRLGIIPREEIIRILGHSPDLASSVMMRMYFELKKNHGQYAFASA